ncbi:MAG: hypothetical protein ACKVY0_08885 [Prosthecobacter sp.]|uniref:hypothetical protein n=1 Tax=Prosthecobacter sp. TaxID=1965333 RepID=UPI0039044965
MRLLHWDAINPHSIPPGQPYRWDDPNLFFGPDGLGYAREPGDQNFISYAAPAPTPTQPKPKHKMPKSDYLKRRDADFAAQLNTFKLNIGQYSATLGVTAAQISTQAEDAAYFSHTLAMQDVCINCGQQWTGWKDFIREGGTQSTTAPAPALFPPAVAAVDPGVELRFRALVKQIKAHTAYNESTGQVLGIEGPVQTGPDFAVLRPLLRLEINGGQVVIRWSWQGHAAFLDMLELVVDRADGKGFVTVAFDTTPDYTDTTPFPATPTKWTYKAIYRVGDQRVGQWSDEVSITVGG